MNMNLIGYKFYDKAKTRRSADRLFMLPGETVSAFTKRCEQLGYEAVDGRNVIDKYKNVSDEIIKGDLNSRRFNFGVLLQNISGDFNKAVAIRNNNAFCGKEVILFGDKQYDRRATVGTQVYENLRHVRCIDDLSQVIQDYNVVIGIDNVENAVPIQSYRFNHDIKTLFIFGEEGIGIAGELLEMCDAVLYIPQYGSVRSLNISCASAIAMYEYTRNFY